MQVSASTGDSFELTLLSYQFPTSTDTEYDGNWLVIKTVAAIKGQRWTHTDPSLLTWEIKEIAEWLRDLAQGIATKTRLDFIESNIAFEMLDKSDITRIKISLDLESRPPWIERIYSEEAAEGPIVECSKEQLLTWSDDLFEQLRKFPQR
jgi:hypothetical protein